MDIFNKTRIKHLEKAVESQSVELKERDAVIGILQTRLSYQEGELKSKQEVVDTLRRQLQSEMEQRDVFQKTFLQFYAPSKQQVREEANAMFLEDEDMVKEISKQFSGLGEGDL
jgi:hypothetical protein